MTKISNRILTYNSLVKKYKNISSKFKPRVNEVLEAYKK